MVNTWGRGTERLLPLGFKEAGRPCICVLRLFFFEILDLWIAVDMNHLTRAPRDKPGKGP